MKAVAKNKSDMDLSNFNATSGVAGRASNMNTGAMIMTPAWLGVWNLVENEQICMNVPVIGSVANQQIKPLNFVLMNLIDEAEVLEAH